VSEAGSGLLIARRARSLKLAANVRRCFPDLGESPHEKDPLPLEIDLNDMPQRKKFLAQ